MLRESVIQYPTLAARLGQKSAQKGASPCWSFAELVNTSLTPPPAEKPHTSKAMLPTISSGAERLEVLNALDAGQNDRDLYHPEHEEGYELVPGHVRPTAPQGGRERVEGESAEPGLYTEPAAGDQRAGHGREICPPYPEGGAD